MLEKQKIIKVKVGEVYINGKNESVWQTFWKKTSKQGKSYYEARIVAFPSEVAKKETLKVTEEDI